MLHLAHSQTCSTEFLLWLLCAVLLNSYWGDLCVHRPPHSSLACADIYSERAMSYPPPQGYPPPYPPAQSYPPAQAYPPPQVSSNDPQPYPAEPPYQHKDYQHHYPQAEGYNVTTVVTTQPVATTTTVTPKGEEYNGIAIAAMVLSIVTLICCGWSFLLLMCILPALCLGIFAVVDQGTQKKQFATISLALSVTAIVCCLVLLVIVVAVSVTTASSTSGCVSYYNRQYQVNCIATRYSSGRCYHTGRGC